MPSSIDNIAPQQAENHDASNLSILKVLNNVPVVHEDGAYSFRCTGSEKGEEEGEGTSSSEQQLHF